MASSHRISRRDFVKVTTAALGSIMTVAMGLPVIGYLIDPALREESGEAWIPLGPLESFPIGIPTPFSFTRSNINGWEKTVNSYGGFVVRKSETEIITLSNICTHLSCNVYWLEDEQQYECPCHDAHFTAAGEVIDGPPPRPLDQFEYKVEEGSLFILFQKG
ncbi:MAG: hypothetical protein B5M51_07300 [Anaerolinea sp. 4484_236]|nr:MAG: hypothetical protein B5M51_07300 [Anaerolinea sp. 4484_236]